MKTLCLIACAAACALASGCNRDAADPDLKTSAQMKVQATSVGAGSAPVQGPPSGMGVDREQQKPKRR